MKQLLILAILCVGLSVPSHADSDNPQPLPGDFELPMPDGRKMVFRPVFLNVGDGPFKLREYVMGNRSEEGFRENLARVQLGGSFVMENAGKKDWMYFIGKYEVTAQQFACVVGGDAPPKDQASLPKTNVTWLDILKFVDAYNRWIMQNHPNAVPASQRFHVRLPSELEWEFAARGGAAVDSAQFDRRTPYPSGALAEHEWFAGPKSSHGKLKPFGVLAPNPLGLHDMLGNAMELMTGLYQIEYLQGRLGGLIARGGDFRTPENELRSSARTEILPFREDGSLAAQDNLGFRLVISAPVFSDLSTARTLGEAWREYAKTRTAIAPAGQSLANITDTTRFELSGIEKILHELETSLPASARDDEAVRAKINLLRSSYSNVDATLRRGETLLAMGGVRLASLGAFGLVEAHYKNLLNEKFSQRLTPEEKKKNEEIFETNKKNAWERYSGAFKQLSEATPETVEKEFRSWIAELSRRKIPHHARATSLALDQFKEYQRTHRIDMDAWEKDFLSEAQSLTNKNP